VSHIAAINVFITTSASVVAGSNSRRSACHPLHEHSLRQAGKLERRRSHHVALLAGRQRGIASGVAARITDRISAVPAGRAVTGEAGSDDDDVRSLISPGLALDADDCCTGDTSNKHYIRRSSLNFYTEKTTPARRTAVIVDAATTMPTSRAVEQFARRSSANVTAFFYFCLALFCLITQAQPAADSHIFTGSRYTGGFSTKLPS